MNIKPEIKRTISLFVLAIFAWVLSLHSYNVPGLVWNLVLAWIPYAIAWAMLLINSYRNTKLWALGLLPLGVLWLLFFPNAPYLLTSYMHFSGVDFFQGYGREFTFQPWYDLLIFTSYVWCGVLTGFASLDIVHKISEKYFGRIAGWAIVVFVSMLSGWAIYLGRFARLNSWDIFRSPWLLFWHIPLSRDSMYFIIILSAILVMIYVCIRSHRYIGVK